MFEVIVIDDGSSDNTSQIQEDFPNIKYFYQNNSGVSSARNLGIQKSTNEWIAFLDSDDEWHTNKLQEQVNLHTKNQNLLISYSDEKWIRNNVEVKIPKKFKKLSGYIFKDSLSYCNIAPSSVMINTKLLDEVGLFDENLEVCEDYDLWLRILFKYEIGLVEKKLITKYAGHENQLSFKHWGMDRFRVQALEKLIHLLKDEQIEFVEAELLKKYNLLLKGAVKYDKISDIKEYKVRIEQLNTRK